MADEEHIVVYRAIADFTNLNTEAAKAEQAVKRLGDTHAAANDKIASSEGKVGKALDDRVKANQRVGESEAKLAKNIEAHQKAERALAEEYRKHAGQSSPLQLDPKKIDEQRQAVAKLREEIASAQHYLRNSQWEAQQAQKQLKTQQGRVRRATDPRVREIEQQSVPHFEERIGITKAHVVEAERALSALRARTQRTADSPASAAAWQSMVRAEQAASTTAATGAAARAEGAARRAEAAAHEVRTVKTSNLKPGMIYGPGTSRESEITRVTDSDAGMRQIDLASGKTLHRKASGRIKVAVPSELPQHTPAETQAPKRQSLDPELVEQIEQLLSAGSLTDSQHNVAYALSMRKAVREGGDPEQLAERLRKAADRAEADNKRRRGEHQLPPPVATAWRKAADLLHPLPAEPAADVAPARTQDIDDEEFKARVAALQKHTEPGENYRRQVFDALGVAHNKRRVGGNGFDDLIEAEIGAGLRPREDIARSRAGEYLPPPTPPAPARHEPESDGLSPATDVEIVHKVAGARPGHGRNDQPELPQAITGLFDPKGRPIPEAAPAPAVAKAADAIVEQTSDALATELPKAAKRARRTPKAVAAAEAQAHAEEARRRADNSPEHYRRLGLVSPKALETGFSFMSEHGDVEESMRLLDGLDRADRLQKQKAKRDTFLTGFHAEQEAQFNRAEAATNGYMVNKRGTAKGVTNEALFYGPKDRIDRYASDELVGFFEKDPRLTLRDYYKGMRDRRPETPKVRASAAPRPEPEINADDHIKVIEPVIEDVAAKAIEAKQARQRVRGGARADTAGRGRRVWPAAGTAGEATGDTGPIDELGTLEDKVAESAKRATEALRRQKDVTGEKSRVTHGLVDAERRLTVGGNDLTHSVQEVTAAKWRHVAAQHNLDEAITVGGKRDISRARAQEKAARDELRFLEDRHRAQQKYGDAKNRADDLNQEKLFGSVNKNIHDETTNREREADQRARNAARRRRDQEAFDADQRRKAADQDEKFYARERLHEEKIRQEENKTYAQRNLNAQRIFQTEGKTTAERLLNEEKVRQSKLRTAQAEATNHLHLEDLEGTVHHRKLKRENDLFVAAERLNRMRNAETRAQQSAERAAERHAATMERIRKLGEREDRGTGTGASSLIGGAARTVWRGVQSTRAGWRDARDAGENTFGRAGAGARRLGQDMAASFGGAGGGGGGVFGPVIQGASDFADRFGQFMQRSMRHIISFRTLIVAAIAALGPLVAVLGALGAAALGVGNIMGSLAGSVAALPGLFLAAAAGIGALMIAFAPMAAVFKAYNAYQQATRQGSLQLADSQRKAAAALTDAQHAVTQASIGLQQAQFNEVRSQVALNETRRQAARDLQDLRAELERANLNEEGAILALRRAEDSYRKVLADGNATQLDREEGLNRVKNAEFDLRDVRMKNQRLAQDAALAEKRGVDGNLQVVDARNAAENATIGVTEAVYQLAKSQRDLTQAQRESARGGTEAYTAYMKLQDELNKLSPSARIVAEHFIGMTGAWRRLQQAVQERMFAPIVGQLGNLDKLLPVVTMLLSDAAGAIGNVTAKGIAMMSSGPWRRDFGELSKSNATILNNFGDAGLYVAQALKDIAVAAIPFTNWVSEAIKNIAADFANWAEQGRKSGSIAGFLDLVRDRLSGVGRVVRNVWDLLVSLFKASTPFTTWFLGAIERVTKGWADWGKEQEKTGSSLRNYLERVKPLLGDIWDFLKELGKAFGKIAADPRNIKEASLILRYLGHDVLPALVGIFSKLSETHAISNLVKGIGEFLKAVERFAGSGGFKAIQVFVEILLTGFTAFFKLLSAPVVGPVLATLLALTATLAAVFTVSKYTGLTWLIGRIKDLHKWLKDTSALKNGANWIKGLFGGGGKPGTDLVPAGPNGPKGGGGGAAPGGPGGGSGRPGAPGAPGAPGGGSRTGGPTGPAGGGFNYTAQLDTIIGLLERCCANMGKVAGAAGTAAEDTAAAALRGSAVALDGAAVQLSAAARALMLGAAASALPLPGGKLPRAIGGGATRAVEAGAAARAIEAGAARTSPRVIEGEVVSGGRRIVNGRIIEPPATPPGWWERMLGGRGATQAIEGAATRPGLWARAGSIGARAVNPLAWAGLAASISADSGWLGGRGSWGKQLGQAGGAIGTGALTGGMIGSVVPVIGTGVGAAVGGIAGGAYSLVRDKGLREHLASNPLTKFAPGMLAASAITGDSKDPLGSLGTGVAKQWSHGYEGFMRNVGSPVASWFKKDLPEAFSGIGTWFTKTLPNWISEHLTGPVKKFFTETLPELPGKILKELKSMPRQLLLGLAFMAGYVTEKVKQGLAELRRAWNSVKKWWDSWSFGEIWDKFYANFVEPIKNWAKGLGDSITNWWNSWSFGELWDKFYAAVIAPVGNWFAGLPTAVAEWWKSWTFGELWNKFWANVVSPVINWFAGLPGAVRNWWNSWTFRELWDRFYNAVVAPIVNWFAGLPGVVRNWWNSWSFGDIWNRFYNAVVAPVSDFFQNLPKRAKEWLGGLWGDIKGAFGAGEKAAGKKASGGLVDGTFDGREDTKPHMLSIGEFVTRRSVVNKPGAKQLLHDLNEGRLDPETLYAGLSAATLGVRAPVNVPARVSTMSTTVTNTNTRNGGLNIGDVTINNPVRERSDRSLRRSLQTLAYMQDR